MKKLIKELVKERLQEEAENQNIKEEDHTYALNAEEVFKTLPEVRNAIPIL